jgi:hypothetical protein
MGLIGGRLILGGSTFGRVGFIGGMLILGGSILGMLGRLTFGGAIFGREILGNEKDDLEVDLLDELEDDELLLLEVDEDPLLTTLTVSASLMYLVVGAAWGGVEGLEGFGAGITLVI